MSSQDLISKHEHQLNITEYIEAIGADIDQLYIDQFWNNIAEDKWIYIDDNLLKWIGYHSDNTKKLKVRYTQLLEKNFTKDTDYKYLNASEMKDFYVPLEGYIEIPINFNGHNRTKHILVDPQCFKESLMLMQTDRAKQIRKYYLDLERIFKSYLNYCNAFKDQLLEQEKAKNTYLIEAVSDIKQLERVGYVYIATSKYNASRLIFKVGYTIQKPKQRLQNYNTVALAETETYYCQLFQCYNQQLLESTLHAFLKPFQYKNELFRLPYDSLVKIFTKLCSDHDDHMTIVNNYINNEYQNDFTKAKADPKPIDLAQKAEQLNKEIRFDDNHSENIFIYLGVKLYLCPRCNEYVSTSSNGLYQHFANRVVKCTDQPKKDMNDPKVVELLISKNNIKIFPCHDCKKTFTHKYLLNNHYSSTTKCKSPEQCQNEPKMPVQPKISVESKVSIPIHPKVSSNMINNLCELYNHESTTDPTLIQFMQQNKQTLNNLQLIRNQGTELDPQIASILKIFNVDFDFQSLSITNIDDIKYLSAKEVAEHFKTDANKSLYSINANLRKLLKPFWFNLNSTRMALDSKKRIEMYFISFNCMNTSYIPKKSLNMPNILDTVRFCINGQNKISIQ